MDESVPRGRNHHTQCTSCICLTFLLIVARQRLQLAGKGFALVKFSWKNDPAPFLPNSQLLGGSAIFAVMSDWNTS
jgi:hypothetical protein